MKFTLVTDGGKITIPSELRKKYGLTPGRKVKFETTENGIRIIPLVTAEEVRVNIGFLGTKGKLLKALMEEKSKIRLARLNDGL